MAQYIEVVRVRTDEEQSTDVSEEVETTQELPEATADETAAGSASAAQDEMEAAKAELERHLQKHSNVDHIVESTREFRILHTAARDGKSKLAKLLLEEGATVDIQDMDKATALHFAAEGGHAAVVEVLLQNKAAVDIQHKNEWTALHSAALGNHAAVVEVLLQNKAAVDIQDMDKATALHYAANGGHAAVVEVLLQNKAAVDIQDDVAFKWTALHCAARRGHAAVVGLLIQNKAAVDIQDTSGITPFQLLRRDEVTAVAFFRGLFASGANLQLCSADLVLLLRGESPEFTEFVKSLSWPAAINSRSGESDPLSLAELQSRLQATTGEMTRTSLQEAKQLDRSSSCQSLVEDASSKHTTFFTEMGADSFKHWWQFLIKVPKVKVQFFVLPHFPWCFAVDPNILAAIVETANAATLTTDTCQALVQTAWEYYRVFTGLEMILNIVNLILLTLVSWDLREGTSVPSWLAVALTLPLAKKFLEEAMQLFEACGEVTDFCGIRESMSPYFRCRELKRWWLDKDVVVVVVVGRLSIFIMIICAGLLLYILIAMVLTLMACLAYACKPRNFADLVFLASGSIAMKSILADSSGTTEDGKAWMALFAALTWAKCLYSLRGEAWFGPRFLPIIKATQDTFVFFLVVAVALSASIHAYYILGARQDPSPLYASIMPIVRLAIFGDFDLFEFEGLDPTFASNDKGQLEPEDPEPGNDYVAIHALFYITGLGITILLMNLLIGVLGANYELYEDQSQELFIRERAQMLRELQQQPWHNLWQSLRQRMRTLYGSDTGKHTIWFIVREEQCLEDLRSLRSIVRNIVVRETNQVRKETDQLRKEFKEKTNEIIQLLKKVVPAN